MPRPLPRLRDVETMGARGAVPQLQAWLAPRWARGNAALGTRSAGGTDHGASAAIRIPERVSAQLALVFPTSSPQLFVHEGARRALERKLLAACPARPVVLSI